MGAADSILAATCAGLATSIGPCVAPRYIAMIGICAGKPWLARMRVAGALGFGMLLGYLLLANVAALLTRALSLSYVFYWVMSSSMVVAALVTILRSEQHQCKAADQSVETLGGAFLLGISSCLVLSPCCSPVVAGFGAFSTSSAVTPNLLVVAFCVGHFAPLISGAASPRILPRFSGVFAGAGAIVSAGLLACMGVYYGLLA